MKFTANQIANILEGEIEGNENVEVFKLSKIEEGENGSLTFLSNPKYTPHIFSTRASIALPSSSTTSLPLPKRFMISESWHGFYSYCFDRQKLYKRS